MFYPARFAASMNFRIKFTSFTPGADSTPDDTSTMSAPVTRMASATFPVFAILLRPYDALEHTVDGLEM